RASGGPRAGGARAPAAGAEPATIGVVDGRMRVGLPRADLERLAATRDVPKLNLSNLAATLAAGGSGSTTVAATMLAAHPASLGAVAARGLARRGPRRA